MDDNDEVKGITISARKVEALAPDQRQELYEFLGRLGLTAKHETKNITPAQRRRTFIERAYPETEPIEDAQIEQLIKALPAAVDQIAQGLEPWVAAKFKLRYGLVQEWLDGASNNELARKLHVTKTHMRNMPKRFAEQFGRSVDKETLQALADQQAADQVKEEL